MTLRWWSNEEIAAARRISGLVLFLIGAVAGIGILLPNFSGSGWPNPLITIAIALGFVASDRLEFHVESRTEAIGYSPGEVVLGIGLVFLDPLALIIASGAGIAISDGLRRQTSVLKSTFNAVNSAFEISLAFLILHLSMADQNAPSLQLWAVIVAAIVIAQILAGTSVATAIACFEGDIGGRLRGVLSSAPITYLPSSTVASSVATATLVEPWLGLVVAAIAPMVWWVVRSHGALRREVDELTGIHLLSTSVGSEADIDNILMLAATQVADNMRAGSIAIRVWNKDLEVNEFAIGPRPLLNNVPSFPPVGDDRYNSPSTDSSGSLTMPLRDERGTLGMVCIADRMGIVDQFDSADLDRLTAMLGQLVIAIRKSQLYSQIQYDATHDRLTGLSNRSFFEAWVDDLAQVPGQRGAVFLLDLNHFKDINDAFGSEFADEILQQCALRISEQVPEGSLVARLGGDEFAIYVPEIGQRPSEAIARGLTSSIDRPFSIGSTTLAVTSSIGIALAPRHGESASLLLRRADIAMFEAKRVFTRFITYRPGLDETDTVRLSLIADLRQALTDDELDVEFQPKIDIASGALVSAEALVRWTHNQHGPVRPDIFVELAEQSGMIEPLTDAVMRKAVDAAASWQRRNWDIGVAVNVSAQSLLDERLIDMVRGHLERSGLRPDLLTLEITESIMMGDPELTHRMLHQLTSMGIGISVDDFGTGFSSLSSLRQLPVSELKIDRSFVSAMDSNHHDAVIVRSTIDLAHNLGLQVVAEGAETLTVLTQLGDLTCDLVQGFGISRPLRFEQMNAWIAARTRSDAVTVWQWGDDRHRAGGDTGVEVPDSPPTARELAQMESNAENSSSNAII